MVRGREKVINDKLDEILMSTFRSGFKLGDKDKKYIEKNGMDKIREHAYDFIKKRIASDIIFNDGKQTPTKGHPVFIAQHAAGTCCRGCLYKCHGIIKGKRLTSNEINYIVDIIMLWIERQLEEVK